MPSSAVQKKKSVESRRTAITADQEEEEEGGICAFICRKDFVDFYSGIRT